MNTNVAHHYVNIQWKNTRLSANMTALLLANVPGVKEVKFNLMWEFFLLLKGIYSESENKIRI